jgi:hypothetical protein
VNPEGVLDPVWNLGVGEGVVAILVGKIKVDQ